MGKKPGQFEENGQGRWWGGCKVNGRVESLLRLVTQLCKSKSTLLVWVSLLCCLLTDTEK